jgi:hypothetical protein
MSATLGRSISPVLASIVAFAVALPAVAGAAQDQTAQPTSHRAVDTAKFFAGAAEAFAEHEADHLLFDVIFDAHPYIKSVHFGPVPFFAVAHRRVLSPRREFVVSSAGFWTQEATSEWLLTRRPNIRREHAPFAKGAFAFDVLTSIGYGLVAFAEAGPYERDTRGMAASVRVSEPTIGAIVIAPAVLDAYRYFNPESKWAVWTSRIVKVGSVLLVVRR